MLKFVLIVLLISPSLLLASGHGPLFGLATPVNFKNTWTLDIGEMNRRGAISTDISARVLLSYGITEDITASFSAPYMFRGVKLVPGRQAGTMPGTSDFELFGSWRLHKKALGIGKRIESTIYMEALLFPLDSRLMIFSVITRRLMVFGVELLLDIFRVHIMFGLVQVTQDIIRVVVVIRGHRVYSIVQSMDFVRHLEN